MRNIVDEFLTGTDHDELRARFFAALGVKVDVLDVLDDPDQTVEALSLSNYRTGITTFANPSFALGSFYSIEASFPRVCTRLLKGLRALGFPEESMQYISLHAETDVHHASEWMDILRDLVPSDADRASVVAGALAQLQLRHEMFVAIEARVDETVGRAVEGV